MNEATIDQKKIGPSHRPYIIAEMSGNHNGSKERGLELIDAAAEAGADAIKFQTYTADTMTIDTEGGLFSINDKNSLWDGYNLYKLYQVAHTPWEWHEEFFKRAKEKGITAFSSAFDVTSVDFLEALNVPAYKIASFENNDHNLLRKVAGTKKPVIMSTGLSSLADVDESVRVLREAGCEQLILMKCTSDYPAKYEDCNISVIPNLSAMFSCPVGLSDHTIGIGVPLASVGLGACVIEKHFTLDRSDGGVDSAFSLDPSELRALVEESERAYLSIGKPHYRTPPNEERNRRFKRSIYIVEDMKVGEKISEKNTRVIRPGDGLEPKYLDKVLGCEVKTDLKRGTPLSWDKIK